MKSLTFVVLDTETTGLDARRNEIIEIGMVKCKIQNAKCKIVERYQSLVRPHQAVTFEIEKITSITNEMLASAPAWEEIQVEVRDFIGEAPVVGHNLGFDLDFLKSQGIDLKNNKQYDTYTLGTMLVREAPAYNLDRLCDFLGAGFEDAHRALADAEATAALFAILLGRIDDLKAAERDQIADFIKGRDWVYEDLFLTAGMDKKRKKKQVASAEEEPTDLFALLGEDDEEIKLDLTQVSDFFASKGGLADCLENYESRSGQIEMADAVGRAFLNQDILAIEAGTGVGKTLAYLVPAALLALQNKRQIVVATHTHHLQDQLYEHDLPLLRAALKKFEIPNSKFKTPNNKKEVDNVFGNEHGELRFALLKGRKNYLCQRRFFRFIGQQELGQDEITFGVKIMLWLPYAERGEKQEIALVRNEYRLWNWVCSIPKSCGGQYCTHKGEPCFYARAWQKAKAAHIIVTNQAFLAVSQTIASSQFPYVIIDEAQHLEYTLTDQYAGQMDEIDFKEWLQHLGRKEKGLWRGMLFSLSSSRLKISEVELENLHRLIQDAQRQAKYFFKSLKSMLAFESTEETEVSAGTEAERKKQEETVGYYRRDMRINSGTRQDSSWLEAEKIGEELKISLDGMASLFTEILDRSSDKAKDTDQENKAPKENRLLLDELEQLKLQAGFYSRLLDESLFAVDDRTNVTYLSLNPRLTSVQLNLAPLWVGKIFFENILKNKKTVVMTSATLTTARSFDYFLQRLGLEDVADTRVVESPFDYPRQVRLYIPPRMPLIRDRNYDHELERHILELVKIFDGRTLVLFTSYSQLKRVHQAIFRKLEEMGIRVLSQGIMGSRGKIIHYFKEDPRSVILGTNSFWEGVDFPGDELRCVVITKLPFDVPSDPIFAARSEQYDQAFMQYSVPRAILKFRQGFGRLIRTQQDSGVVAILDSRVINKRYGQEFLESLPSGIGQIRGIEDIDS